MDPEKEQQIVDEVEQLRSQLVRQNSLRRMFLVGIVYGVGFFLGSAILATIALGIFGPWLGHISWIRTTYEAGSDLLHHGGSPTTTTPTTTTTPGTTTTGGGGNGIAPYNSGISGTVTTSPTCPVETNPPQAGCAPKPYSTVVAVFRSTNSVTPFATAQSDATGAFKISLPPGSYVVGAGESNLPRCPQTPATVQATGYTNITIVCDTGIR